MKKSLKEILLFHLKKRNKKYNEEQINEMYNVLVWDQKYKKERNMKTNYDSCVKIMCNMMDSEYPDTLMNRYIKFKTCSSPLAYTEEKSMLRYGLIEGKKRFDSYKKQQAYTNTFEYKQEKYGWSKEQFDDFNASRAVTLENMIKRHGKEEGTNLFNEYCNKQKYVGVSLDYFINTYGKEKGEEKYYNMLDKKLTPLLESLGKISSKQEKEVINILINNGINLKEELINSFDGVEYNEEISYQFKIISKKYQKTVSYDACIFDKKILIEYNGDLWHGNVRNKHIKKLLENNTYILCESIKEHIKKDEIKKKIANDAGFKLYVIWELDWNKNKEKIINHLKEWIINPNEYFSTEELFNESY